MFKARVISLSRPIRQEYADALNELTPEQAEEHRRSVEKALAAARELEIVKQKLDEQRLENEEKLKQENEGLLVSLKFIILQYNNNNVMLSQRFHVNNIH